MREREGRRFTTELAPLLAAIVSIAACAEATVANPAVEGPMPGTAPASGASGQRDLTGNHGLPESDWQSIRTAIEAHQHAAHARDDGIVARNPGQRWQTHFDGSTFIIKPDAGGWTWGLELLSFGRTGAERLVSAPDCIEHQGTRVSYQWDASLTEWYLNDRRGLEHGYTLHDRPAGSNDQVHFTLAVRGGLQPRVSADGRDISFVDADGHGALNYSGLTVFDADGTTLPARFVLPMESGRPGTASSSTLVLVVDDRGARYPLTIDPVAQQAYLKASNTEFGDGFGMSVAASGDTVVIGAFSEDSGATGVDGAQTNGIGTSGAAYVFVKNGGTWSQQAYLKASNTGSGDVFGYSVAISGDTIVVGAYLEDSNATGVDGNGANNDLTDSGAAYVFVRNGSTWSHQAYLKSSAGGFDDYFGRSVAVSGDTVVVGAFQEDSNATGINGNAANNSSFNAGAAYVFVRNGASWSQQAYLKASNTSVNDQFGRSVAASGDTIVIGAGGEDSDATGVNGNQLSNAASGSGAAYVFIRSGTTWSQQAYLKASNTGPEDQFGYSVSASGDLIVVGAFSEDSSATGVNGNQADNGILHSGAAYVFTRSGTVWSQEAYLKASNTGQEDWFGWSVAAAGERVVVGARQEESNATGVDGNQSDDSLHWAGAAYLFERSGGFWTQLAYLKASNTEENDEFGWSVSISGDLVVVGAPSEDSQATGVDGNQGNADFGNDSGAAYAYFINSAVPCPNDLSGDGQVDGTDLAIVLGAWGTSGAPGITGDLSLDGFVDGADLALVLGAWGGCP